MKCSSCTELWPSHCALIKQCSDARKSVLAGQCMYTDDGLCDGVDVVCIDVDYAVTLEKIKLRCFLGTYMRISIFIANSHEREVCSETSPCIPLLEARLLNPQLAVNLTDAFVKCFFFPFFPSPLRLKANVGYVNCSCQEG